MGEPASTITAVAAVLTALGAILGAYWAYRARQATKLNEARIVETQGGIYELGQKLDGRLEELLRISRAAARAEGVAAGEQSQRDRSSSAQE